MAKKPRENRIPIMMSDEELEAIDDWRFENRIATRSDAIRRLCKIALLTDSHLNELVTKTGQLSLDTIEEVSKGQETMLEILRISMETDVAGPEDKFYTPKQIFDALNDVALRELFFARTITLVYNYFSNLLISISPLIQSKTIHTGVEKSDKLISITQKWHDHIEAQIKTLKLFRKSIKTLTEDENETLKNMNKEEQKDWFRNRISELLVKDKAEKQRKSEGDK